MSNIIDNKKASAEDDDLQYIVLCRKGDTGAKFSTWLYRIVVNCTKNRLKQRKNLARHESASLDESAEGQGGGTACLAVPSAGNPCIIRGLTAPECLPDCLLNC